MPGGGNPPPDGVYRRYNNDCPRYIPGRSGEKEVSLTPNHANIRWITRVLLCSAVAICGCSKKPKPASASVSPASAPLAAALGETTTAGPFRVKLTTHESHLSKGSIGFQAEVTKDAQPVSDAKVTLNLSQPALPISGPSIALKWDGERYAGRADVPTSGDWHADVVVDAPGDSGTAIFAFSLNP